MSEMWSRVSMEVREEVLLRESGSCRIVCMACCPGLPYVLFLERTVLLFCYLSFLKYADLFVLFFAFCPYCPFFSLFVLFVLINSFLSFYVLLVDYILEWLS